MKKIYINPEHSDQDPSMVDYAQERKLNIKVSNFMKEYLFANYAYEVRSNPGTISNLTTVCAEAAIAEAVAQFM